MGDLITVGSPTSTGGKVLSGENNIKIDGLAIAVVGGIATCASGRKGCRGQGPIVAADRRNMTIDGKIPAKRYDTIACGCNDNVLLSSKHSVSLGTVMANSVSVGGNVNIGSNVNINIGSTATASYGAVSDVVQGVLREHNNRYGVISDVVQDVLEEHNNLLILQNNCPHKIDGALLVAEYIIDEIKTNIKSHTVKYIRDLLDYDGKRRQKWQELPTSARIHMPYPAPNTITAMTLWTEKVFKNRPWDHKKYIHRIPKLQAVAVHRKLWTLTEIREQRIKISNGTETKAPTNSESYWHKYKTHDYYYDIWSNIHYGYVGLAAGFDEKLLLGGAALAQFIDNFTTEGDAPDDINSIKLGFKLYKKYGDTTDGLTPQILMEHLESIDYEDSRDTHFCIHPNMQELRNSND